MIIESGQEPTLIETWTAVRNRVLKLLEGANIKLSGFASDVFGVSGMAMCCRGQFYCTSIEMCWVPLLYIATAEPGIAVPP